MSNGAEMSYTLACHSSHIFKAIAPVAGTMFGSAWTDCEADPTPVLEIHGTNDNITLWEGDLNDNYWGPYPGTEEVIDYWVNNNECQSSEDILIPNSNTINHRFFDCIDNTEVWLYEVINGGHDWPAYSSQEIWSFFSLYLNISGDINQDNIINILDVIELIQYILESSYYEYADINEDSFVDILDVVQLVNMILN